jgi:hypothetical protein
MSDTQVNRIGDAIAAGIRGGLPMADVVASVNAIVHDPERAYMIAETEYSRARTVGARETYRLNGVPMVAWLSQPDACPRCKANQEVSPIPLSARWPSGDVPVHPRCRCAEAPYVTAGRR